MAILFVVDSNFYRHLSPSALRLMPPGSRVAPCTSAAALKAIMSDSSNFDMKYWFVSALSNTLSCLPSHTPADLDLEIGRYVSVFEHASRLHPDVQFLLFPPLLRVSPSWMSDQHSDVTAAFRHAVNACDCPQITTCSSFDVAASDLDSDGVHLSKVSMKQLLYTFL